MRPLSLDINKCHEHHVSFCADKTRSGATGFPARTYMSVRSDTDYVMPAKIASFIMGMPFIYQVQTDGDRSLHYVAYFRQYKSSC